MFFQKRKFTLYWSSLAQYENCPQSYLWGRGWGTIDLGNGPGRSKTVPVKTSKHHAVMGMVLAHFWERLYNDHEWQEPEGLLQRMLEVSRREFDRLVLKEYIEWHQMSRDEMWATIRSGIEGYLRTMMALRLLGPYARSEQEFKASVDEFTPIGGRADLVFHRDDSGTTILDGKNSRRVKDKGKWKTYTDPDQLRWYALCMYLQEGVLPDRLGFVYFRYPYGEPVMGTDGLPTGEQEPGVTWVPYTLDDLKGIALRAQNAMRGMEAERFEPTPSATRCKLCDFETVCQARQDQKQANRRVKRSNDEVGGVSLSGTGVQTLGFGASKHTPINEGA